MRRSCGDSSASSRRRWGRVLIALFVTSALCRRSSARVSSSRLSAGFSADRSRLSPWSATVGIGSSRWPWTCRVWRCWRGGRSQRRPSSDGASAFLPAACCWASHRSRSSSCSNRSRPLIGVSSIALGSNRSSVRSSSGRWRWCRSPPPTRSCTTTSSRCGWCCAPRCDTRSRATRSSRPRWCRSPRSRCICSPTVPSRWSRS